MTWIDNKANVRRVLTIRGEGQETKSIQVCTPGRYDIWVGPERGGERDFVLSRMWSPPRETQFAMVIARLQDPTTAALPGQGAGRDIQANISILLRDVWCGAETSFEVVAGARWSIATTSQAWNLVLMLRDQEYAQS